MHLFLLRRPIILWILVLLACLGNDDAAAGEETRRKRFVAFRKGSTFFYRLNYKLNTLPYTTMFAQASGFKIAWELPSGTRYPIRKARSALLDDVRDATFDGYQINGHACLLRSLCQAIVFLRERDGVLRKILNLLSSSYSENGTVPLDPLLCRRYIHLCPLDFVGANVFTGK